MVAGGGGGAGGFGAGGFLDEDVEGLGGADTGGCLDEDGAGLVGAGGGWALEDAPWTGVWGSSPGRDWIRCSRVRAARVRVRDSVVVSKSAVTLWSSLEGSRGRLLDCGCGTASVGV